MSKGSEDSEPVGGVSMERVDKFSISVFPPLNPDHEEIKVTRQTNEATRIPNMHIPPSVLPSPISAAGHDAEVPEARSSCEQDRG